MSWGPDPDGVNGVYLGKNVVTCAASALEACLTTLTPRVSTKRQVMSTCLLPVVLKTMLN
jgi:hypothetical protein